MKHLLITLALSLSISALADEQTAPAAPAAPAAAAAPASVKRPGGKTFTGEAKVVEERMDQLFEASRKVSAPGETGRKAKQAIEGALDWERVAQECLGPARYKKTSESNRNQFRNLLHEVIVKTAYGRFDAFWKGATYSFDKIDVKGNDAHVVSKFLISGDTATLDYYLTKKAGNWLIHDIAYEDLRYSKNINEQLDAFLKEKGFPNLLAQLRKRLEELDDANKPAPTKKG